MPDRVRGPLGCPHPAGKLAAPRRSRPNWRISATGRSGIRGPWPLSLRNFAALSLVGLGALLPHKNERAEDKGIKHFSSGSPRDAVGMIDAREDAPADGPQAIYAADDGS